MQYTLADLYNSPLHKTLFIARQIYTEHGQALLAQDKIQEYLQALESAAHELQEQMCAMQMPTFCADCGSQKQGGCCSAEMANENDAIQLLMNLLVGCDVSQQRDDRVECYLLGTHGCILKFKPMFCLNYNCSKIIAKFLDADLKQLNKRTGNLLENQYALEQFILWEMKKVFMLF